MHYLDFHGKLYKVEQQESSSYNPDTILVGVQSHNQLSYLYPFKSPEGIFWLFEVNGHAYRWEDTTDPRDWEEMPLEELIQLLTSWHTHHREFLRAEKQNRAYSLKRNSYSEVEN